MNKTREERAAEDFARYTADHQMTVVHDDGLYRHLRFQQPETWMYGFFVVTFPGHLVIDGDLQSGLVFARIQDMIEFFTGPVNPTYWSEKITNHGARDATREYAPEKLEARVMQEIADLADHDPEAGEKLLRQWREELGHREVPHNEPDARLLLDAIDLETWEWDLHDWTIPFLLTCHALHYAATTYREANPL